MYNGYARATASFLNGCLSHADMVKRKGGPRRKTRRLMRKHVRTKGKISLQRYYQPYEAGEVVVLVGEPAVQKGFFHSRFWGKRGKVVAKSGHCYMIEIQDKSKTKRMVVHPVHLRKA